VDVAYIRVIEANKVHYFSTYEYFDIQLYMFRTYLLSIIRSLNTVFTAVGIRLLSASEVEMELYLVLHVAYNIDCYSNVFRYSGDVASKRR
jgi:hypothetical protein